MLRNDDEIIKQAAVDRAVIGQQHVISRVVSPMADVREQLSHIPSNVLSSCSAS